MLDSVFIKVKGCSAKVFKVSNNNLAGTAIEYVSVDSITMLVDIVVSRSEADRVKVSLFTSNKKLSRIGRVFVEFTTPPIICNSFNKTALDTMNFI